MSKEYYKAYEERYKQVHKNDTLWFSPVPTLEVMYVINDYNISKKSKILDLGCGEGRDALYLLKEGYDLLALDYSDDAIKKCQEMCSEENRKKFRQFDIMMDTLNEKFDFIYSIAVLHMFIDDNHRRKFYKFIRNHLKDNGVAFIVTMGDGEENYTSDKDEAFKPVTRININTNEEMSVASTSCRIVDWTTFRRELKEANFFIVDQWMTDRIPDFSVGMCVIVKNK